MSTINPYNINVCAPMFANDNSGVALQPVRKGNIVVDYTLGAFVELFLMYLIYFIINMISGLQNPH